MTNDVKAADVEARDELLNGDELQALIHWAHDQGGYWVLDKCQPELDALRSATLSARASVAAARKPYCHIYEYDSKYFGLHREFAPIEWNGMRYTRRVAVYTTPVPASTTKLTEATRDVLSERVQPSETVAAILTLMLNWVNAKSDDEEKEIWQRIEENLADFARALPHPTAPCDGSGAIPASVDDWTECAKCGGAGCQQPVSHKWDADGERCEKCGDKDWMADRSCSERLLCANTTIITATEN